MRIKWLFTGLSSEKPFFVDREHFHTYAALGIDKECPPSQENSSIPSDLLLVDGAVFSILFFLYSGSCFFLCAEEADFLFQIFDDARQSFRIMQELLGQ